MSRRICLLVLICVWSVATFGVLSLERIPGEYVHEFCGPWGCLPPLQALVAMHGFWLMLFLLPTTWLLASVSPSRLCLAGAGAFWIGMIGLIIVAGRGLTTWLDMAAEMPRYVGHRLLYSVVIATDLPFGQLALAGVASWLVGRQRMRPGAHRQSDTTAISEALASSPAR
jgi:hypothetical protein